MPNTTEPKLNFSELWAVLETEGYHILYGNGMVPFVLQGVLPTGELFYFRMRDRTIIFLVARDNGSDDPYKTAFEKPLWSSLLYEDEGDNDFIFSYPETSLAGEYFRRMADNFADWTQFVGHQPITAERREEITNIILREVTS